jgi:MYXO-CTERM domain-containing protein
MHRCGKQLGWIAPVALAMGVSASARDARACGGLFCSSATPVDQAAERIVFAHDESAGRVTAVIEILYQGPAERFAWILPVSGTPDVGVSTNALLNRLQQATNPTYQIQRTWPNDTCNADFDSVGSGGSAMNGGPAQPPSANEGGGSVSVLASGNAGPYDYEVISVAAAPGADPAQEAIDWLTENGYDTGATGPDLLRDYLENGMNLLAVRLNKQASVGSIRPIKIAYDADESMIPIRPTAVAANADMGVLVWVLGSSRAVPFTYKALELNEALIDWFNPQQSYNDVVIAAANETLDGQGFVTEYARPTTDPQRGRIRDQLFFEEYTILDYRSNADNFSDAQLVADVAGRFSTSGGFAFTGPFGAAAPSGQVALDGVADVLTRNLTFPEGIDVADVLASPTCYFDEFQSGDAFYCNGLPAPAERISLQGFDRAAFMTDVENLVIQPIEETLQLFEDLPYLTRFYTTLSPDEMSIDPAFVINPDLDDVDNQHSLELAYEGCFGDTSGTWEANVGGRLVRGEGNTWPLTIDNREDMPVNLRVLQLSSSGQGEVNTDNSDVIEDLLASQFGAGPGMGGSGSSMTPSPGGDPMMPSMMGSSGGCSFAGTPASSGGRVAAAGLLGLIAFAAFRRRR